MDNKILWLVGSYLVVITLLLTSCTCATSVTEVETTTPTVTTSEILWESMHGPPGGHIRKLIQNPYGDHELYAVTGQGNLYVSEDRGESWTIITDLDGIHVGCIAATEDKIFLGGNGVYCYDRKGNLVEIFNKPCDEVIVCEDKLFITHPSGKMEGGTILFTNLNSVEFDWEDISPSASELDDLILPTGDSDLWHVVRIPNLVALNNRILANIIVEVEGSGELTNGYLYVSENLGESWSKVDLDVPDDVIISKIVQDPNNKEHILLLFRHPILHEFTYPVSELIRESYDGGETWNSVTDLGYESNGVTDCAIRGATYYLLNPYGGPGILKLESSSHEIIDMPRIREFEEIVFNLDALMLDYDNPNVVYGKTGDIWALGLVKSEDNMKTWAKMDRDIIASSPTIVIAHPEELNTVMTSGNVIQESYYTRDEGETWEPFTPIMAGDEVKINPHNPNHIILVDEMTNMYESYDSGKTFRRIATDFSSAKVFDFEITENGRIYVANNGVGISEHDPSQPGDPWRYMTNSPDYTYDIEIDPNDSNILYATYSPKIFESHSSVWRYSKYQEGNFGWTELLNVENSRGITSIALDKLNPNNMYAGVIGKESTIYVSRDGGSNWSNLNKDFFFSTIHSQNQLAIDPTDEDIVYAAPWGAGLFKTVDSGATWIELGNVPTLSIASVTVHPLNPDTVYAAGRAHPILYQSENGGQTWESVFNAGPEYSRLFKIKLDPSNPNTIYVSAFKHNAILGSLFRISNGESKDITGIIPRAIIDIAIDPEDSETIYVSLHGESVYKTYNGGDDWQNLDSMPVVGTFDIEIDPSDTDVLYAAAIMGRRCPPELLHSGLFPPVSPEDIGNHGVYKSEDGGMSWENINQGILAGAYRALAIHPVNPQVIYAGGAKGVYMTKDGGNTWTAQNSGLNYRSVGSLSIRGSKIYAGSRGGGVYVSDINVDYTLDWTATGGPKPEIYNIQIAVDPTNSNVIYASSYPGGMFKTEDAGETWKDKNFFLPSFEVTDPTRQGYYKFAIDPEDPNRLYFAIYRKGIYTSSDGASSQMPLFGDSNEMRGKLVTSVVVDPADSDTIYVSSEEGVFVTRDKGKNWEELNDGLNTLDIRSLKISNIEHLPFEDNFEDGNANGWELQDGWSVILENGNYVLQGIGHKWARAGTESWGNYTFQTRLKLLQGSVHVNFRVKEDEGRYFLGFNEGGLSLGKQFHHWSEFADLAQSGQRYDLNRWYDLRVEVEGSQIRVYTDGELRIDYTDPEPLLNGIIAFESLEDSRVYIDDVYVSPDQMDSDSVVYVGTGGYGLYKLDTATKEWSNLGRTLGGGWWSAWERRMYQFSSILFDPDIPGVVYYGHFPSGFFISEDDGHTWRDSSLGLGNDGMFSIAMHPENHRVLFAGTYNGVVKSVDRGETWEIKSTGIPSEQWPYTVAIDSDNPNIMYASTKNGQNKGFCHRNDFCGVVVKSTDGGENWIEIMNGLDERGEFYTLLIYPPNHNILFLSTSLGVYLSQNAGETWEAINRGLPSTENQVRDNVADNLVFTPDNKYLILGLVNYGVWRADLTKADGR